MTDLPHAEYTKAAAICVNLAVDLIEGEICRELVNAVGEAAETLRRLIARVKLRRIDVGALEPAGSG